MNIIILTKSTLKHQMGGIEVHVASLAQQAQKDGHAVTVITTQCDGCRDVQTEAGIRTYYLQGTKPACYSTSWWQKSNEAVRTVHQQQSVDVIWAESFSGCAYAQYLKRELHIPILSIMQGFDFKGVIKTGIGAVYSFREAIKFTFKFLPEYFFLILPLFTKTLQFSDIVVSVSDETAQALIKEFKVDPDKMKVIYNSVDTELFKPDADVRQSARRSYSLRDDDRVILMSGVVHRQKGMHLGLEAFVYIRQSIPHVTMVIAGSGPYLDQLKALAERLGVSADVIFLGGLDNQQMRSAYNAADLFINPTLRTEGLPLAVVEACACGLPVISSDIGGTASAVDQGVNGFLIKPKDIRALADKAIMILRDTGMRERFSKNARAKAVSCFDSSGMVQEYIKLSKELQ